MSDGPPSDPPEPPETEAPEPDEEAPSVTRQRKKKRRKRPVAAAPEETGETSAREAPENEPAEVAAPDESLPAFALAWPRDPALDALVAAFEAGDYARVRREAPALAKATEDDAVRRAARELRRRLDPDPMAVYMLVAAGALLAFLAGWYWLHPHTL